jgi:hypothetical protein
MSRYYRDRDEDSGGAQLVATIVAGLSVTPLALIFAVLPAWVVMLALGAAHDQWPVIPALGYWTTYILVLGFGVLNPFRKVG